MCDRCDETKAAIDHMVVAALKFAKLTHREMLVGFIGEAVVVMPLSNMHLDVEVAIVHEDSTAAQLKAQVALFMAGLVLRTAMMHVRENEPRDAMPDARESN
jgi:hypothetical protein